MSKSSELAHGAPLWDFRRLPVGAEVKEQGTHFRVWAPGRHAVAVAIENGGEHALSTELDGYFSGFVPGAAVGARYRFRLDEGRPLYPDPVSRHQPEGPHGASEIVDPHSFVWNDDDWPGIKLAHQIIYEMHVGTFTPEGTWAGASQHLEELKHLGITVIEMMPVAEFPGSFGWGYDGVDLFAPYHHYGTPDDLRRFVAHAHALGLGVILDVVYNHFGPDGCYLRSFTPAYFTDRHKTDWGGAINYDGENAAGVREFIISNARYWIDEFHFDGLRLDATHSMRDSSDGPPILQRIGEAAREAAGSRDIILIAENEEQQAHLVRPVENSGYGLDALWNDDFHHSALVALTGHSRAYYSNHRGSPQELISAAKYGFVFQGQRHAWRDRPHGAPALDLPPSQFVQFLENHDQVASTGWGARLHQRTTPGRMRAFTALFLLLPGTPMLFQGQEFGSSRPFRFFADHEPELATAVAKGRRAFLSQFPHLASPDIALPSPGDRANFLGCKLDWQEFERNDAVVALHRDLLALRRNDPVFAAQKMRGLDGAVLEHEAFVLRFFGERGDDRLLFVNYGRDLNPSFLAEPLIAPPAGGSWQILWSSEAPKYGGNGVAPFDTGKSLHIPGHAAVVLAPAAVPSCEPLSTTTISRLS